MEMHPPGIHGQRIAVRAARLGEGQHNLADQRRQVLAQGLHRMRRPRILLKASNYRKHIEHGKGSLHRRGGYRKARPVLPFIRSFFRW